MSRCRIRVRVVSVTVDSILHRTSRNSIYSIGNTGADGLVIFTRYGLIVLQGHDVSFLFANFHTEAMLKHNLVDFIIQAYVHVIAPLTK